MSRTLTALALALGLASSGLAAGDDPEAPDRETRRPLEPTEDELSQFTLTPPGTVDIEPGAASPLFQVSGWGIVAASAADLATTEYGLSRGLEEGNPLASNRSLRLLHHVVGPAAVWYTTERLNRSGRTKLALGLRVALMAAYGYAAFHNAGQIGGRAP